MLSFCAGLTVSLWSLPLLITHRVGDTTVHRVLEEGEVQRILDNVAEQQQQEQAQQSAAVSTQGDL